MEQIDLFAALSDLCGQHGSRLIARLSKRLLAARGSPVE